MEIGVRKICAPTKIIGINCGPKRDISTNFPCFSSFYIMYDPGTQIVSSHLSRHQTGGFHETLHLATHSSVRLGSGTVCFRRGSSFDHSRLNPTAGDPRATSAIWNLCSSAAGLALTALRYDPSVEHSISTDRFQPVVGQELTGGKRGVPGIEGVGADGQKWRESFTGRSQW